MTHKTIMEYYPRHRSLVGRFIEIDDLCGPIEDVEEREEAQYFRRVMGAQEIPVVYYGTDKNFHHVIFCYKPVVAYITFDGFDDYYLAVPHDNGEGYELFNPWTDDEFEHDEVIVAATRVFEDYRMAAKTRLVELGIDEDKIFTSWDEMATFCYSGENL